MGLSNQELFNTPYIRHMYKSISQGTNTRRKKAPASAFLAIPVQVPSDPQEGKKITEVAETLQLEIKLLEQQLALLQKQKRALMEQLLTGKLMVSGLETVHE